MQSVGASPENNKVRGQLFTALFGDLSGLLCLASKESGQWAQSFKEYPQALAETLNDVSSQAFGRDVYFCANLLKEPKHDKPFATKVKALWADLDECDPKVLRPAPSIVVQTSPNRYQSYWLLDEPMLPEEAEDLNHRIYNEYKEQGVDSGWALGKMLRVPNTYNMKYATIQPTPIVHIVEAWSHYTIYTASDFAHLKPVPGFEYMDQEIPAEVLQLNGKDLLMKYKDRLDIKAHLLFDTSPNGDYSSALWNLECFCVEAGMSPPEAFVVARDSACNKYARDNRPMVSLWHEVCKAAAIVSSKAKYKSDAGPSITLLPLLTTDERVNLPTDTFVDRFTTWARSRTDAPLPYHEAGAFVILSTLLAGRVHLPTSWGTIVPNLWVMLIGASTIDRKSTSLRLTKQLLLTVDEDAILATDGSLEGIMTAMQTRPGRGSIFFKDEFSGFLASAAKKEYMAGILEMFTFLYDADYFKRTLRSSTIEVRDPTLILFCGGVRTEILQHLSREHITSGFGARFIYVDAETKFDNIRPMGPPTTEQDSERIRLEKELTELVTTYDAELLMHVKLGGHKATTKTKRVWNAELSPEAWDRYNELERTMLRSALDSDMPDLYIPMFDRLSKSTLKAAVLLASARQSPRKELVVKVEVADILKAISYTEKWRQHTVYITENAGSTQVERKLSLIQQTVKKGPGISRGKVMTIFKLNSKEIEVALDTLEQRGAIKRERTGGKAERLYDASYRP